MDAEAPGPDSDPEEKGPSKGLGRCCGSAWGRTFLELEWSVA